MGSVTPIGNTVDAMWTSILEAKCGIGKLTQFDTENCDIKIAAEVKEFDLKNYVKPLEMKKIDRFSQFAIASSYEAYIDSGLQSREFNRDMFSVIFGSAAGGSTIGPEYHKIMEQGCNAVSKMTIPINLVNMAASNIAIKLKAFGTCTPVVTACASGTDCIGKAYRDIKNGYSNVTLAGASDACIQPVFIAGFNSIGALTKSTDPLRASIPFDKDRNGFVMGEGSGSLILEEYEHAKNRKAKIYAEIVGYGSTCDAYSLTSPDFGLKQGIRAIGEAIKEAEISPGEISYINAHGTSTKYNDKYESMLIKSVFCNENPKIAVSSTKSMMGHLLGAAGAVEAIITTKAINENYLPPTIGYQQVDEECNLDYIPNIGRKKKIRYAMSNSLGFGGHNSVLILKSKGD